MVKMKNQWLLSPARQLTEEEQSLIWQKPLSHIESDAEKRISQEVYRNWTHDEMKITNILLEGDAGSGKTQLAKALSANFGLPYTKVTCFADMDKSDVLGSILPVLSEDKTNIDSVSYKYYPSEIMRAYENGWLLEIQEPTVIRDAAVLMSLNSALEPNGTINLPTRMIQRHPDFLVVITTNRGYNGFRPLNEALRDRVQHSEKMDLPTVEVMMKRAAAKTGCTDDELLLTFARIIGLLDQTAKANVITGVAGMRSYLFWVDAVLQGAKAEDALYYKVIYKMTTDPDEITILEQALTKQGMLAELKKLSERQEATNEKKFNGDILELHAEGIQGVDVTSDMSDEYPVVALRRSTDSEGQSNTKAENTIDTASSDNGEDGDPIYHELQPTTNEISDQQKREFRKQLNQQARALVKGSSHEKIKLIVHRPEATIAQQQEYHQIAAALLPTIQELVRKTAPLLEHEVATTFANSRVYGTTFHAEKLASPDFHYFSQKSPPHEQPSLAVALRIDNSASMNAFGRLEAAKQAAVAVYEFCKSSHIPLFIYGDTADRSSLEQMSLYSYIDDENPLLNDKYCLMTMQGHSNNRDGMALRIIAEKLIKSSQQTKLLISISDGQPKAMPDYSGEVAIADMKNVIDEFSRKGILFVAAAIGQDKETISHIYGQGRSLDISDLRQLPARLVRMIAKYL